MTIARDVTDAELPVEPPNVLQFRVTGALDGTRTMTLSPSPLSLTDVERASFGTGLVRDPDGRDCLAGLTHVESVEFVELQRRGLDNDDAAYLRWVRLGDLHVAARSGGR